MSVISEGLSRNQKAHFAGVVEETSVVRGPSATVRAGLRGPTGDVEAGEPLPAEPRGHREGVV